MKSFKIGTLNKISAKGLKELDAKFSNFGPMLLVSLAASIMGGGHYFISDYFWLKIGQRRGRVATASRLGRSPSGTRSCSGTG